MILNVRDVFPQCDFAKGDQDVQIVEKHDRPSQNADWRKEEQRGAAVATVIIILLRQGWDQEGCDTQPQNKGSSYRQTRDWFLGP